MVAWHCWVPSIVGFSCLPSSAVHLHFSTSLRRMWKAEFCICLGKGKFWSSRCIWGCCRGFYRMGYNHVDFSNGLPYPDVLEGTTGVGICGLFLWSPHCCKDHRPEGVTWLDRKLLCFVSESFPFALAMKVSLTKNVTLQKYYWEESADSLAYSLRPEKFALRSGMLQKTRSLTQGQERKQVEAEQQGAGAHEAETCEPALSPKFGDSTGSVPGFVSTLILPTIVISTTSFLHWSY